MTGLSSGGYMASHAAVELAPIFTAVAPVSSGNPFTTIQDCNESLTKRKSVKGILYDMHTRKQIIEHKACASDASLASQNWPTLQNKNDKPTFRMFHHKKDGIVDLSCMEKMDEALKQQNYPHQKPLIINNFGRKKLIHHLWRQRYNQEVLDFFQSVSR